MKKENIIGKLEPHQAELFKSTERCKRAVKEVVKAAIHEYEKAIACEDELWNLIRENFSKVLSQSEADTLSLDHNIREVFLRSEADIRKGQNHEELKSSIRLLWEKGGKLREL